MQTMQEIGEATTVCHLTALNERRRRRRPLLLLLLLPQQEGSCMAVCPSGKFIL